MAKNKFDAIVEAVHLDADGQLKTARIYEKRGPIFTDHFLVSRDDLIKRIKDGEVFLTGKRQAFMGSVFDTGEEVRVVSSQGNEFVTVGKGDASKDQLQTVPHF